MTEALIDHLWQSTLFALAAALLTLVFRKDSANVRFNIWLIASVKFLLPLSVLVYVGRHSYWGAAPSSHATPPLFLVIDAVVQPGNAMTAGFTATPLLANTTPLWHWNAWVVVLTLWALGCATLLGRRVLQWVRLYRVIMRAAPLDIDVPIPVRSTATTLEPGIFGIVAPVLLLPDGIATRLAPEQLRTIVAHELCHWRRKDNLTAAIHMVVESLFWFHPLVWWLGARMLVERERAVDEAVIRAGSDRQVYAEGILKVCQFYVEPPPSCAAGVSGGTLRKRIEEIMTNQVLMKLHFAKRCLLTVTGVAAVAGPFALGLAMGPHGVAQARGLTADNTGVTADTTALTADAQAADTSMRHYKSTEWNFELDIPRRWNPFPPVSSNSPYEVIRFESEENGHHGLIVFRIPSSPQATAQGVLPGVQQVLTKNGFSHFVTGETTLGTKKVATLDFDRPMKDGSTWSCREYFIMDGTLMYTLGFGTSATPAPDLYDRIVQSFVSTNAAT